VLNVRKKFFYEKKNKLTQQQNTSEAGWNIRQKRYPGTTILKLSEAIHQDEKIKEISVLRE
jgi:hypothetical protein